MYIFIVIYRNNNIRDEKHDVQNRWKIVSEKSIVRARRKSVASSVAQFSRGVRSPWNAVCTLASLTLPVLPSRRLSVLLPPLAVSKYLSVPSYARVKNYSAELFERLRLSPPRRKRLAAQPPGTSPSPQEFNYNRWKNQRVCVCVCVCVSSYKIGRNSIAGGFFSL